MLLPKWDLDLALRLVSQYVMLSLPRFPSLTDFNGIRYKITTLNLIPSVAHQLVNSPKTEKADLSSLIWVTSGAAYLPDHLSSKLMKLAPKQSSMVEGASPPFSTRNDDI